MPPCRSYDPEEDVDDTEFDPEYVGRHIIPGGLEELEMAQAELAAA